MVTRRLDQYGYRSLPIRVGGKTMTVRAHRLVATAFLGPRPYGCEVRHLDGNKLNNAVSNLAYGTNAENGADKRRMHEASHGSRHPKAKLTEEQVITIRARAAEGPARLSREFGVCEFQIHQIVRRRQWTHI